jgi:hypothetical protein
MQIVPYAASRGFCFTTPLLSLVPDFQFLMLVSVGDVALKFISNLSWHTCAPDKEYTADG